VAVDLQDGTIAWKVPSGHFEGVDGWPNFGHPLATGGGLVFHAATRELALRAHDIDTGEVLARFPIPAGLHAGPITYRLSDEEPQLLVIAPGGHIGVGSKMGDYVIAYALPKALRAKRPHTRGIDAPSTPNETFDPAAGIDQGRVNASP
jgi:quinoprotein glucose dehydrogenase